jgi:molybdate transport system substrate-binding protein
MPRAGRFLTVAGAAVLAAGIAACATPTGAGGAPASSASPSTQRAPATVTVFAAASLTEAFDLLAEEFEQRHPNVEVVLNSGGSAALAQQVVEGAPVDVFASAAEPPMQAVVDAGLAADPVVFATNTLQLVVPAGNPAGITGLGDLGRSQLRIALCDDSVPCGAASVRLLAQQGVQAAPDTLESDVRAVLTKVALGEVDAALVYRTDVLAGGDAVEGIEVPDAASVVNRYPIATITDAASPAAAADFASFVASDEGRAVLDELGFGAP